MCNLKVVTHGGTLAPCAPASLLLNLKKRFDCGKPLLLVGTSLLVFRAVVSVTEPSCPAAEFTGELIAFSLKVYVALSIIVASTVYKVLVRCSMCANIAVRCSIKELAGCTTLIFADNNPVAVFYLEAVIAQTCGKARSDRTQMKMLNPDYAQGVIY